MAPMRMGAVYDRDFFDKQSERSVRSARAVVPIVQSYVNARSVVDVGCGVGAWLSVFAENGASDFLGLDGEYVDKSQLLIPPDRFQAVDLSRPMTLSRTFDLAVCLEVVEHLPPSVAPQLVRMLTSSAPCVLFSAAMPGQGGAHHINERWPQYWRKLFESNGYERLDPIRPQVWREQEVDWLYKQNIFLFCRSSLIEATPLLQREAAMAVEWPFELLHKDVLDPLTTIRGLARHLVRELPRMVRRLMRFGN